MIRPIPLTAQVEMIFRELEDELSRLTSGTVFVCIDDCTISTFGVRHRMDSRQLGNRLHTNGMNPVQLEWFRVMAMDWIIRNRQCRKGTLSFTFWMEGRTLLSTAHYEENADILIG